MNWLKCIEILSKEVYNLHKLYQRRTIMGKYQGTSWLQGGFEFPTLAEYITQKKKQLTEPLTAPEYAASWERNKFKELSEKLQVNPYMSRAAYHKKIKDLLSSIGETHMLTYQDNPMLYDICVFVVDRLIHVTPMIWLYDASPESGLQFNAFVYSYQEQLQIFISSQFFREYGMMSDEELCFIVGHEIGHAHCRHIDMEIETKSTTSDYEYSADRAGIIACTALISQKHPEYTVAEAARMASLYSASALMKLNLAVKNGPGNTDWTTFDYQEMQAAIDSIFDNASQYSVTQTTHPHLAHRIMAIEHFRKSQMLYRCLKLPVPDIVGLNTDEQLAGYMAYQMKNYAQTKQ